MMEEKFSSILFLLLFCCFCLLPQIHQTAASKNFVQHACKKYEEELINLCIAVVDSDPHPDLKLNFTGLLTIFINHSIANASDDHMYVVEQLKRSDLTNRTRQDFEVCDDHYKWGIDILRTSLQDLLNDPTTSLVDSTNMAYGMFQSCEDEFFFSPPEPPSWLSRYQSLRQLLELALGATNFLQCKKTAACIP